MRNKGFKHSEETKLKIRNTLMGHKSWNKGLTKENNLSVKKISEKLKGNICYKNKERNKKISISQQGENNSSWNGGSSFKPYSINWTKELRNNIRKRDNFWCQECAIPQNELNKKLLVHHIDYNKLNCDENNLISLCNGCHSETNFNREYWKQHFYLLNEERNEIWGVKL